MDQNEETFEYRYSAKQQEEIEAIRRKYLPKEEDKMEQLRQMDKRVSRKGMIISIIIGVIGIVMIALAYPLYERITKKNERRSRR